MIFPIIRIKSEGHTHIVGTNTHDVLYIKNNAIHYLNVQGYESTEVIPGQRPNMEFVGEMKEYSFSVHPEIEFVTFEELVEIAKKEMAAAVDAQIQIEKMVADFLSEQKAQNQRLHEAVGEVHRTTAGHYLPEDV